MKRFIYNIAALALAIMASAACSDRKEGAGDIMIGFAEDSYSYKEGAGLTKIRFDVTGEAKSYPVTFDIVAQVVSTDGAELEEIVHFTQLEGMKVGGYDIAPVLLEFFIKDNDVINEPRSIELTISNVKGAGVSRSKTVLEIRDNDNDPYDKLMGDWTATANDYNGSKTSFPVNISGGFTSAEIEANEGRVLVCWGFGPYQREYSNASPSRQPVWYLDFAEDEGKVYVQANTLMANVFSFADIPYQVIIRCCGVEPGPKFSLTRRLEGSWNKEMDKIVFEDGGYGLTAAIFNTAGEYTESVWMIYTDIVLTRNK